MKKKSPCTLYKKLIIIQFRPYTYKTDKVNSFTVFRINRDTAVTPETEFAIIYDGYKYIIIHIPNAYQNNLVI